ncbi:MAG: MogA/MoaB family molybdenum cofactor biosynthesis protein [Chloroflexi bacterium]|nr:MogA/MoaB family molybdenum cofactor biosynthesis protein [Chloroflexota bacterium]
MFTVGILTISDLGARGLREDTSAQAIREVLARVDCEVREYRIVPDEQVEIEAILRSWADNSHLDVILTTGGTGLGPRDVTPEATMAIVDRVVPGIAEGMRVESLKITPYTMLSRATAGTRGRTLIVNLPGSAKGARECLEIVLPVIPHALAMLGGGGEGHQYRQGG